MPPRRTPWLIAALAGCFYAFFHGGHIYTPDGVVMAQVTRGLVDHQSAAISDLEDFKDFGGAWVEDEATGERRFYAYFGLGMSLAAAPAYALGRALLPLTTDAERDLFHTPATAAGLASRRDLSPSSWPDPRSHRWLWTGTEPADFALAFTLFCAALTNCAVVGLTVGLLYAVARRLGYSARAGGLVALAAALATPLWHYAQTFFSEPLAGLLLLGFLWCTLRARAGPAAPWLALAGFCVGAIGLTKVALLALGLPAGLLLLWEIRGLAPPQRAARSHRHIPP